MNFNLRAVPFETHLPFDEIPIKRTVRFLSSTSPNEFGPAAYVEKGGWKKGELIKYF